MFTIEEINHAATAVKTGADFPAFVQQLKKLGVIRSDVFVINGMATYYGADDFALQTAPVYEDLLIHTSSSPEKLSEALVSHQHGETDYQTFCRQAADAGIEKWEIDLKQMTVSYLDTQGTEVIVEQIKPL